MGKIKTRLNNMIVGSDFSAQEPRVTAFLSQDPNMLKAYREGKDLYAVIAQSVYDNKYEDNLEFYPEGTKVIVDGKEKIAGNGKESTIDSADDNSISVPSYYSIMTPGGWQIASALKKGDVIIVDDTKATIERVDTMTSNSAQNIIIYFK